MASSSNIVKETEDRDEDINYIFDNIVLSEQRSAEEGFQSGYKKGILEGEIEGFHLGYHRGAELGAELGYYKGVVEVCLATNNSKACVLSEKVVVALHKVKELLEQFPTTNTEQVDIISLRDHIRAKYKKACALMKIIGTYPETKKMEITRSNLQAKLNEAIQFLNPLLPLANCHMVDFITGNLWETLTPTDIKDDVKCSNGCNINEVFDETFRSIFDSTFSSSMSQADKKPREDFPSLVTFLTTARDAHSSSLSHMISWQQLQEELISLGSDSHPSLYLDQFMTGKKAHEVEVMSQVVASLANASRVSHIVDVGSGKGYLSSMLALHHGLSVLGIDSSQSTSHGAVKRTKKLVRVWNGITKKGGLVSGSSYKQRMDHRASMLSSENDMNEPTSSALKCSAVEKCKYKQATLFVTPHMNLLNLVESYFPESCERHNQLALVGLHTCGDLAPTALRILASNDHVTGLCNVGCCYHLLNEEFVSDNEEHTNQPAEDYGFPMSDYLRSKQFVLGRNARMLAAQSLDRIANTQPSLDSLHYRALLQVLLKKRLGGDMPQTNVGRLAAKCSNFSQYVHKALSKLELDLEVSEEEIDRLYAKHVRDKEYLQAFFVLRLILAPAVEGIILLDRLLFLLEQGISKVYLVRMFDPLVSPRCYGIVALKSSSKGIV